MKTYLVSEWVKCEDGDLADEERRICGVVRAVDVLGLYCAMDEVGNPNDYEYMRVPNNIEGGFVDGEAVAAYPHHQMDRKWKAFQDLIGVDFLEWYATVYIPSLPKPVGMMPE